MEGNPSSINPCKWHKLSSEFSKSWDCTFNHYKKGQLSFEKPMTPEYYLLFTLMLKMIL